MQVAIRGGAVLVDEADASLAINTPWRVLQFAGQSQYALYGKRALHREIMQPPRGLEVDHINGDGLDNRRSNLRLATRRQNAKNLPAQQGRRSPFKGVMLRQGKAGAMFVAAIQQDKSRLKLGSYDSEHKAARVYDAAARLFHGKFARTNEGMGLYDKHPDRSARDLVSVRRIKRRRY